jgi:hypothetical protein
MENSIKFVLSVIILGMLGLYLNAVKHLNDHEITYNPNTAVPLSSFISQLEDPVEIKSKSFTNLRARRITPYTPSITIPANVNAYIDKSLNLNKLIIKGNLFCDNDRANTNIKLKVNLLNIDGGVFQCGRTLDPYTKNLTIALKHTPNLDPKQTMNYRALLVHMGGKLTLNGKTTNAGWVKLKETAEPGDNFIIVDYGIQLEQVEEELSIARTSSSSTTTKKIKETYIPWKVGDKIAIASTSYNAEEAEDFIITGKDPNNPNKLYLNKNIQYRHWGEREFIQSRVLGNFHLDERAEVANLTRNIKIISDESDGEIGEGTSNMYDQIGGHVMVHHNGKAYISGVEFYKLGQAGVMARYPFHWHWIGDAPKQYVINSSIHHSFQRCIVIHRTNDVRVQKNTCYNFKGHGYFLEDGTEVRNKLYKNLAIYAKGPDSSRLLLASDDVNNSEGQGRFPSVSAFWISHPFNYVADNVAAGSVGTGFWMSFETEIHGADGTTVVARPLYSRTLVFDRNIAHGNEVGITWDGSPEGALTNNPNNPNDRKVGMAHYEPPVKTVFSGNKAYKNMKTGMYFRGQSVVFKDSVLADNGWGFWMAYNQIMKDNVIIGKTNNTSAEIDDYYFANMHYTRGKKTGVVMYDGPFEVYNTDFINFSTQREEYTKPNGQKIHSTYIPFTTIGGTNKYTNIVSNLYFDPDPIYRVHLEDPDFTRERGYLGNSSVRDLDGSLSGTGQEQILVARRAQSITPDSNCYQGDESLYNYQVCPDSFTEHYFDFFRWGGYGNPWATPFVTRRNDGATNFPINEWMSMRYNPHNKFTIADDMNYDYELMPYYSYYYDRNNLNTTPKVSLNTEAPTTNIPIVNIKSYGYNCSLNNGAIEASSMTELRDATQTSYMAIDDNFYVKVIPNGRWKMIDFLGDNISNAQSCNLQYTITCDDQDIIPEIKGKISSVGMNTQEVRVKGWACEYGKNSYVTAQLFAIKETTTRPNTIQLRGMAQAESNYVSTPVFIAEQQARYNPSEDIAFECGRYSNKGHEFDFTIPHSITSQYPGYKFYVKVTTQDSGSLYLENSGRYWVPQLQTREYENLHYR